MAPPPLGTLLVNSTQLVATGMAICKSCKLHVASVILAVLQPLTFLACLLHFLFICRVVQIPQIVGLLDCYILAL
jgi:hypothetical protein